MAGICRVLSGCEGWIALKTNGPRSDASATPDNSRRVLYRSLALAFAALVALVLVGIKWWGDHVAFSRKSGVADGGVSSAATPALDTAVVTTDTTNIVLAVLVAVLLALLMVLAVRLARNYRRAVTTARQTTAATEFNEARLMDFVALSSDWLWETDTDHRFTLMSGGIRSIANMDSDDFTGRALWDIRARPTDGGQWASHIRKLEQRAHFTLLVSRTDLTGLVRHLEFTGKPLFDDGKFIGYRGVGRDVTQQLESDRHLRTSEERFRTLVESFYDRIRRRCARVRRSARHAGRFPTPRPNRATGTNTSRCSSVTSLTTDSFIGVAPLRGRAGFRLPGGLPSIAWGGSPVTAA